MTDTQISWHTEFRDKRLKLSVLMSELNSVASEWHRFGIQLGVDYHKLSQFEKYTQDVKFYLSKTLQLWFEQDPPPTVQDLLNALRSPVLNYCRLAGELEEKYKGNHVYWFQFHSVRHHLIRNMYGL